ncbi:sulfatase family protein [Algoriphagus winogradskyi]|uniref:Arylsulfatase A n=1 Tax=Algoriphagus winogradskyi TaxID=237017 RepID=A0ABY1NZ94_9BACT|nr:sulfatase [Algoriphagus winogradskyi]SMP21037.1 Arylsulfatase A [Algoriphagus winogradskyi]
MIRPYLAFLFLLIASVSPAQDKKQPNIIYIMSDDHTTQAVGVYGGRLATLNPTPNLDYLAGQGMRFDRVFATNSICTPSRATIMTGQYPQTNGVLDLDGELAPANQYLPQELSKLGYSTAIIGKWHLKQEPAAFDYYEVLDSQGEYFDPYLMTKTNGAWPNNKIQYEGHSSDVITDRTLAYLQQRDKTKPFFLMHHYKAPHDMFEYAPRYEEYLEDVEIPEPASLYSQPYYGSDATVGNLGKLKPVIGTSVSDRHILRNYVETFVNDTVRGLEGTHLAYQEYLKKYLRCVKGVDDNLGRLFDYLKAEGLWENTVIIYTGDQGMMLGEHDLMDKRWMLEESMRMPFIVHYPKLVKANSSSKLLINNTDFAPTMISLAGGEVPSYMQGKSFANTLAGKTETDWREATYYRYWMHMIHHWVPAHFGIRTDRYKLIFYYAKHYLPESDWKNFYWEGQLRSLGYDTPVAWELYDLENDPNELHNRYNDPAYKEIVAKLKADLLAERKALNETDAKYPEIQKVIDEHWED